MQSKFKELLSHSEDHNSHSQWERNVRELVPDSICSLFSFSLQHRIRLQVS